MKRLGRKGVAGEGGFGTVNRVLDGFQVCVGMKKGNKSKQKSPSTPRPCMHFSNLKQRSVLMQLNTSDYTSETADLNIFVFESTE